MYNWSLKHKTYNSYIYLQMTRWRTPNDMSAENIEKPAHFILNVQGQCVTAFEDFLLLAMKNKMEKNPE